MGREGVGAGGRREAVETGCAVYPDLVSTVGVGKVVAVAEGDDEDLLFVGAGSDIALVGLVLAGADIWCLWLSSGLG